MCISLLNCNCFGKRKSNVTFHKIPSATMSSPPYSEDHMVIDNTSDHRILTIPSIPIELIYKVTDNFGTKHVLDGSHGRVYYGALRDKRFPEKNIEVAFKKIMQSEKQTHIRYQISTISKFDHDNIIKIIGYCDFTDYFILATEYANSRSLYDSLHGQRGLKEDKPKQVLAWKHRVNIAYRVAKALQYLHDKKPPMCHGNIKSSNVLLFTSDHGVNAKLSDFYPQTNNVVGSMIHSNYVLGSFGYDSPEASMTGNFTIKSDIYSYGVILLELLTGRKPIDRSVEKRKQSLIRWCVPMLSRRLHECMDPKLEGAYNTKDAIEIASIAEMCLNYEAPIRPEIGNLVRDFQSSLI